jgi:multiple sugar transport system ATP-binding protein
MAHLQLRDVKKSYGPVDVIHGVDLEVKDGEFVVFVGPSGCGKSTLLRMIAGLEEISSGEVKIDAAVVNHIPASERGLAMVFQSYALYPHMSVYKNMAFGLENMGLPKAEIDKRVSNAANLLRLTEYLQRKPKALSGGQRQRVAIGRAIVRNPKICLFDEPLSNLDAELRVAMRKELSALHADLGGTMIYVTHDQVEAMTLADRIVVLRAGRIEQVGAPLDLYNRPNNLFVATFIGSPKMNVVDATVAAVSGASMELSLPGGRALSLPFGGNAIKVGQKLSLGIRPEHIDVVDDGELEMAVDLAEQLGGETYFYATGKDLPQFTIREAGQAKHVRGDTVRIRPRRDCVHLFAESGEAVQHGGSAARSLPSAA